MERNTGESFYTKSVSILVNKIHSNTVLKDSLFQEAETFFSISEENKATIVKLKTRLKSIEESLESANTKQKVILQKQFETISDKLKKHNAKQTEASNLRILKVVEVCKEILLLSEGENYQKTQINSAKLLGTLQLLSPGEGLRLRQQNQKLKPAYKAVVAVRLLDKLISRHQIKHDYLSEYYVAKERFPSEEGTFTDFQNDVAVPLIIATLFQDVGLLHPKAQLILKGEDGTRDEFAILDKEKRLALLKLNHKYSLEYINLGLGTRKYVGNSKAERDLFVIKEKARVKFIQDLLVGALSPKLGIGNLVKIPQIYASFIFSSKPNQTLLDLPKAGLVIANAAKHEAVSQVAADALLAILGHFPQGFGITYIPKRADNSFFDRYEYAIVTGLNPTDPFVPICRVVTRNLEFVSNGQMIAVDIASNLYFPEPKKKFEKISPERLREILSKLASNFEERKDLELIPSNWNPFGFFEFKNMQNLWKKN